MGACKVAISKRTVVVQFSRKPLQTFGVIVSRRSRQDVTITGRLAVPVASPFSAHILFMVALPTVEILISIFARIGQKFRTATFVKVWPSFS